MSSRNSLVCAIDRCKTRENQQKSRKSVFLFRFPKVRDLANKWLIASNRQDLMDLFESQNDDYLYKNQYMVCSNHFELSCFKNKTLLRKGLIQRAVPTKNLNPKTKIIKSCTENMLVNVEIDEVEIKVEETMCSGCLSIDRITIPLGHLKEMYLTLVGPSVTIKEVSCCWECLAVLRRLQKFQIQLKHAQEILTQIYQDTRPLSTLTVTRKDYWDREIQHSDVINNENDSKNHSNYLVNYENDVKDDISWNIKEETAGNAKNEKKIVSDIEENALKDFMGDSNGVDDSDAVDDSVIDDTNVINDSNVDFSILTAGDNNKNEESKINGVKYKKIDCKVKKRKLSSVMSIKNEYKSYAKHICHKKWKKPYSHYFTEVKLDEAEIENTFLVKDRKRQGCKMNFKCENCALIYGRKIDLDRHNNLNHHKPHTSYKCLHCKESQSSLESLKEHWLSHSVFYKCNLCFNMVFPCGLALHLSRSHVNVYACTNCTMTFSSLVSFSEHYNKNHPFVCDYCSKRCALRSVLEKHIRNHHTPHPCIPCVRTFDSYQLYRAHCRDMHPDVLNIGAEPEMCYCVECDRQFPSRSLYMKHVNSKHTIKPPSLKKTLCPECGRVFNKNSDMLLHYNFSHVKVTKYHCDQCNKYFLKRYGLRTHMESVHLKLPKPKNKICDLCGRAFQNNSVLDNHRRTHTGERPFKCGVCPAAFAQKGAMKIHQRKQHSTFR